MLTPPNSITAKSELQPHNHCLISPQFLFLLSAVIIVCFINFISYSLCLLVCGWGGDEWVGGYCFIV